MDFDTWINPRETRMLQIFATRRAVMKILPTPLLVQCTMCTVPDRQSSQVLSQQLRIISS